MRWSEIMIDDIKKRTPPSKKIGEELKNLRLLLIGSIIFSFFMGILANIVFTYFNYRFSNQLPILFVITFFLAIILAYWLYYRYVFVPNSRISRDIVVSIIYDSESCEIIDDPFDGYSPQKMAWMAFKRFKEKFPDIAERRIKEGIDFHNNKKHILTELLEYIIIHYLSHELLGFEENKLKLDKTVGNLPNDLEKNAFISFFKKLEPKDIIDKGMQQLQLYLPRDIKIKYWSPAPIKGKIPDPNTFQIGFVGKYIEIYITAHLSSMWTIGSITCGPVPIFEGIYIREYWQDKISTKLGRLKRVVFRINIEAKLKLRYGLFLNLSYIDWADSWINEFYKKFDFYELSKKKMENILYEMYETIKEIRMLIKRYNSKYEE